MEKSFKAGNFLPVKAYLNQSEAVILSRKRYHLSPPGEGGMFKGMRGLVLMKDERKREVYRWVPLRVKYIIFLVRMREWVFSASIQKVVNKNLTTNPKATNKEPTSNPKPTPNQGNPKSNPQTTSKQEATHKESRNNRIYVCIRIRFFQIRR